MTQQFYRTKEAARYLGISQSTLERKRVDGTGPKFRKMGSKIVAYSVDDLNAWAGEQVFNSTSEAEAA